MSNQAPANGHGAETMRQGQSILQVCGYGDAVVDVSVNIIECKKASKGLEIDLELE